MPTAPSSLEAAVRNPFNQAALPGGCQLVAEQEARIAMLTAGIDELEKRLNKNSSNSGRPPFRPVSHQARACDFESPHSGQPRLVIQPTCPSDGGVTFLARMPSAAASAPPARRQWGVRSDPPGHGTRPLRCGKG